mgnify:CR=1 FL=1
MEEYIASNGKKCLILNKINSKELAYVIGFISADASIDKINRVEISTSIKDKSIIEFISKIINSNISVDETYIQEKKIFPRYRTSRKITDILKFVGNRKKEFRNIPIISNEFTKYLVLGFFDGDGCITWGRRKDRNRIWQNISFTSSYFLLESIQKILLKIGISSSIKPKGTEKCFVLKISSKKDVLKFCEWIYSDEDFIILKRKFDVFRALRLELGEFGETV